MTAARTRERWLFAAMLGSGLLVVASHGGVPLSCASQPFRPEFDLSGSSYALQPGQDADLELARGDKRVVIERGTVVEIKQRGGFTPHKLRVTFAGYDPRTRTLIVAPAGEPAFGLPAERVDGIDRIGLRPKGTQAAAGAVLGGLAGTAIGAAVGVAAMNNSSSVAAGCYVPLGAVLGGGVGTGAGAIVGSTQKRGIPTEHYGFGSRLWHIANVPTPVPAPSPPLGAGQIDTDGEEAAEPAPEPLHEPAADPQNESADAGVDGEAP